jgi:hypothetical protein
MWIVGDILDHFAQQGASGRGMVFAPLAGR